MAATTLLTSDQFLALPEEFDQHGNRINELLIEYLRASPLLGLKTLVEIGAQVSDADAFIPDVSVVQRSRLSSPARVFQGSPDIAIEVVSPSDTAKHLERKVDAYLQRGAKSVWMVFPDSRSITVHAPESVRKLKADQSITDPLLPAVSCPVASFFELT